VATGDRTIRFPLGAFFLVVMLSGCPGMSPKDNAEFRDYVVETLSPGMPFVKALQILAKDDFQCDDRGAAPAVTCIRQRGGFMYTCLYRILLHLDAERKTVLSTTAAPIACTGM
jgi:hypothetical protein